MLQPELAEWLVSPSNSVSEVLTHMERIDGFIAPANAASVLEASNGPSIKSDFDPLKIIYLMNVRVGKTLLIIRLARFFLSHSTFQKRITFRISFDRPTLVLASLIFSLREEAGARDVIAAGNFVDPTSMSDSSTADEAVKENLKVSKIQEAVIRIAGNSQDGISPSAVSGV